MADPMRIRAQVAGDKATVRVLMSHEMETGQRKGRRRQDHPAWFIQEVSATTNGKPCSSAQWGAAVAKNPFPAIQCQEAQGRRQDRRHLARQQGTRHRTKPRWL